MYSMADQFWRPLIRRKKTFSHGSLGTVPDFALCPSAVKSLSQTIMEKK
jgi:hypothetical protein